MKIDKESKEIIISDPAIAAVFRMRGFDIESFLKNPQTVAWRIRGEGILDVLKGIYNDELQLPIGTFIKTYRDLRGSIQFVKQLHGGK